MYKRLTYLCALSIFSATYATQPMPEKVVQIMEQTKYQHANWGILVRDTVTGEVLYEKNPNQFFLPGSTTKLFSTAAVINAYGDNYRFKTPVYAIGSLKEGVLRGNLVIVGQGDLTFGGRQEIGGDTIAFTEMDHIYADALPAVLTPQDPLNALNDLARQVKEKGVTRIDGNILIDDRLFETTQLRGLMVSPLLINENLIDVVIQATDTGKPATVSWRPQVPGYKLVNECATVAKSGELDISLSTDETGKLMRVSGTIPEGSGEVVRTISITDPKAFARDAFIQALRAQGIVVTARTAAQLPPQSAYSSMQPIAVWTSPPLSEYVKLILKVSHNTGANICPLLLAVKKGERTFEAGLRELGKFTMNVVKVPADAFVFVDGAGGDGNRLTPQAELMLLDYVRSWPKQQFERYYNGLPILGVDGSIGEFGKGSPAVGKVYAKTGTGAAFNFGTSQFFLTTQALTGYIEAKNGHLLEFMVVVNNANMPQMDDIYAIFEDECQMTIEFYDPAD